MNERKITTDITIGGQPMAEDIQSLAKRGFRTIVNLRTDGEQGALDEEKRIAEEAGLDYAEIPVAPNTLDDLAVHRFEGAVTGDSPPAYVHCGGGGRAGIMTLLHLTIVPGWSLAQAYEQGQKLGDLAPGPNSPYRAFFEAYIKRHSPAERV